MWLPSEEVEVTDFKMVLGPRDITDIVVLSSQLRIQDQKFIAQASYEEVQAAYVIMALEQFLTERRIPREFSVQLSEEVI